MARITSAQIERIKAEVSLIRLIEAQGYALTKNGKDFQFTCPFHDDRDLSVHLSFATNEWECKPCALRGNVIDWVMKTQGVSFRLACELLQNDVSVVTQSSTKITKQATTKKLTSNFTNLVDADDQTILNQMMAFYHETLKQRPEALAYLEKRGLNHPALIEHFTIGFSNRTLPYRLPAKNRHAGALIRNRLQALGILRNTGHEHFSGSMVVPITDADGIIVDIYGRKLRDDLRKGTAYHTGLHTPPAALFNVSVLTTTHEVILCQSVIDALTFWVNGFKQVVAHMGLTGFTADHLNLFKAYGIERVLIAYEKTEAGDQAAERISLLLNEHSIESFRIVFMHDMDANMFAVRHPPSMDSIGSVVRNAQWMGKGKPPALTKIHPAFKRLDEPAVRIDIPTLVEDVAVINDVTETLEHISPLSQPISFVDQCAEVAPIVEQAVSPPPIQTVEVTANVRDHDIEFYFDDRRYRIRGLFKNAINQHLKVNVLVHSGELLHVDTLDFYSAKGRTSFIKQASTELGVSETVIKADLAKLLLKLEELQEQYAQEMSDKKQPAEKVMAVEEREAALSLLKSPNLLERVLADFAACGVVGEETNKLAGYLACVSRKLDRPLAVIIQSTSAAGKSSLMEAILAFIPQDERIQYSAMTGQSLFYMGQIDLKNKILAIAEEEGIHQASYALKLLQSEGEITIASTGKDDVTGDLITKEYKVEGRIMLFLTTTAIDIDEELLNRCLVLTVNETREQTKAIHAQQRIKRTLAGLHTKIHRESIITLQQNAQRLLRPLQVINPYANELSFSFDKTRTRRDHEKYLTLIDSIALLHQYQRDIKTIHSHGKPIEYVEVTLSDIETANQIAHAMLGRTLDELPPQSRNLLTLIQTMITEMGKGTTQAMRFTRKQLRDYTGWGNTQLKLHCQRLVEFEYLMVYRGSRNYRFEYELVYYLEHEQQDAQTMQLIDTKTLEYDVLGRG
jgi:DNA primase catalytic core